MIALRTLGLVEVRDTAGQPVAVAPKPLALLLYLALARPAGPQRRDHLVVLFYPDTDQAHAQPLHEELRGYAVLGTGRPRRASRPR